MRNEAYKLTSFTVIAGALGFFLHWLQNMRITEEETGLAVKAPISVVVSLYMLIIAVLLALYIFFMIRPIGAPLAAEKALCGATPLFMVSGVACALAFVWSGVAQLLSAGAETWVTVHRICGFATILGGLGVLLVFYGASRAVHASQRCAGAVMLVMFACFWLVTTYKDAASDPVVWHTVVDILAVCATVITVYYVAGYFFDEPKPMHALFFTQLGAFLCVMSSIDEHTTGETICILAAALLQFTWGFVIVENMGNRTGKLVLDPELPDERQVQ